MFYSGDVLSTREYYFITKLLNRKVHNEITILAKENKLLKLNELDMLRDLEFFEVERYRLIKKIIKLEKKLKEKKDE